MDALPDQKEYECIQNGDFCFCNSNISISVFTEVSGLSIRLELVDIVNHC